MERYGSSLKTARNTKIHVQGAISNRPGTIFGGPAHPAYVDPDDGRSQAVLVPFVVSESQSYILALTDYVAQVWTSRADGTPVPLAREAEDCPEVASVISTGTDTILELDADHDFINGQDIFVQGATGDWAAANSDLNGAYPRFTAELVEDAGMGSAPLDEFYAGNQLTPPAFNFDSAALLSESVVLRDEVDVWLTGTSGQASVSLIDWQQLIGRQPNGSEGRISQHPYRYSMNLYYTDGANNWSGELLWPGCSTPDPATASAVDHISDWSVGDRKIFPKPVLSSSIETAQVGTGCLTAHFIDKRRIKLVGLDSSGFVTGTIVGASLHGIAQFNTPYTRDEASDVQYAQSLDVLTCAHPGVPPHTISHYSAFEWRCAPTTLLVNDPPVNIVGSASSAGDKFLYSYRIIGIDGFPDLRTTGTGQYSEATQVDVGMNVALSGPAGTPTDKVSLAWDSPAWKRYSFFHIFRLDRTTATYKFLAEVSGSGGPSFTHDDNVPALPADTSLGIRDQYTRDESNFVGTGNYPRTVNYNNQRLLFAGTDLEPERVWLSKVGDYTQFNLSDNIADPSAALQFNLAVSNRLSSIFSSVALQQLILLTDSGEISAGGGEGFASMNQLPGGLTLYPQSYYGAAEGIMPALADDSAVFIQKKGGAIRDIRYRADGLAGAAFGSRELSVLSSHLLEGETVLSLAFADSPDAVVYAVLSSGAMLAMTYSQEHGIVGFNRWDTGGISFDGLSGVAQDDKFLSVAVIPEGEENGVYVTVLRYPPSSGNELHDPATAKVFIERLVVNPTDRGIGFHNHLDCGFRYSVPISTDITGARIEGGSYYILKTAGNGGPVIVGTRVDVFEKSGIRASRNTSLEAYGQFAVIGTQTIGGEVWSKLGTPGLEELGSQPAKVDILDLEVRFPVTSIPPEYVTHAGSGWRPSGTYGVVANGEYYEAQDPADALPSPNGNIHTAQALRDVDTQVITTSAAGALFPDKSDPIITPDGQSVIFVMKGAYLAETIYRVPIDGGAYTRLSDPMQGSDTSPAISPDGTKIAFVAPGYRRSGGTPQTGTDIFVMDAELGESASMAVNITNGSSGDYYGHPSWSPDSSQIAFHLNSYNNLGTLEYRIWIMDADGNNKFEVTHGGAQLVPAANQLKRPAWSPDGLTIACDYEYAPGSTSCGKIPMWPNPHHSGNQATGLAAFMALFTVAYMHPSWAPDGDMVFVELDTAGSTQGDIWALMADGSLQFKILGELADETHPAGAPTKPTGSTKMAFIAEVVTSGFVSKEVCIRDGGFYGGAASHFFFGEPFTAEVETNPLGARDMPATAATKRVPQVGFRVTNAHSIQVAAGGGDPIEWVAGTEVVGHNGALLYDGQGRVAVPAGSDREQTVKITQPKPHPFTLSGLYPEMEVEEE